MNLTYKHFTVIIAKTLSFVLKIDVKIPGIYICTYIYFENYNETIMEHIKNDRAILYLMPMLGMRCMTCLQRKVRSFQEFIKDHLIVETKANACERANATR